MPNCSKGWSERCAASKGKRCRCACGGSNHGRDHEDRGKLLDDQFRIGEKSPRSGLHARWELVAMDGESITIRDVGHTVGRSVTTDAEWVAEEMAEELNGRRLFYYDSMHQLDEIVIINGRFDHFKPTWKWAAEERDKQILQSDAARARPELAARLVETLNKAGR